MIGNPTAEPGLGCGTEAVNLDEIGHGSDKRDVFGGVEVGDYARLRGTVHFRWRSAELSVGPEQRIGPHPLSEVFTVKVRL